MWLWSLPDLDQNGDHPAAAVEEAIKTEGTHFFKKNQKPVFWFPVLKVAAASLTLNKILCIYIQYISAYDYLIIHLEPEIIPGCTKPLQ